MEKVEPIRDLDILEKIYEYLKLKNERDYIMFMIGTNTGLRISDILPLKIRDVKNKKTITIKEKKTGNERTFAITYDLSKALKPYIEGKSPHDYLLPSNKNNKLKPIGRQRAYTILREIGDLFNLEHIGTHTMRKTFGYHFYYKYGKDVVLLQHIFGHSDPSVTLRYIGVTDDICCAELKKFSFFKH